MRQGRRGADAQGVDVGAGGGAAGHQRRHQHVARATRVLAHQDAATRAGQAGGDGAAQRVGQRGLEVLVGDAADAVGAEEVAHEASATVTRTVSGVTRTTLGAAGGTNDGHDLIVAHLEVGHRDLDD